MDRRTGSPRKQPDFGDFNEDVVVALVGGSQKSGSQVLRRAVLQEGMTFVVYCVCSGIVHEALANLASTACSRQAAFAGNGFVPVPPAHTGLATYRV